MANVRVRDLLDQVKDFHRELRAFYGNLSARAKHERVRMLLDYMAEHEKQLEEALASYEERAAAHLLDTWFEFTPDLTRCQALEDVSLSADMTVDDAVAAALQFDTCLAEYYKQLAELSPLPEVRELFENLKATEESESRAAARAAFDGW